MRHEVRVRGEKLGAFELPDDTAPEVVEEARDYWTRELLAKRQSEGLPGTVALESSRPAPQPGYDRTVPQRTTVVCGICGIPVLRTALGQHCKDEHGVDVEG